MSEPTTGNAPEPKPLYCGNCGALIPSGKHFCPNCLAPASLGVPEPPKATTPLVAPEVPKPPIPPTPPAVSPPPKAGPEPSITSVPPAGSTPAGAPAVPPPVPVVPVEPNLVPPVVPGGTAATPPPPSSPTVRVVPAPSLPQQQPVRWPWILLAVGAGLAALILLSMSCILLLAADTPTEGLTPGEARSVALLCCLLPGLILAGGAILGGVRAAKAK